jgi:L-alanine-DL-glutamate epimerase-like enolase superfamily enzyme
MYKITRVEVHVFGFDVPNRSLGPQKTAGVGNGIYEKGSKLRLNRYAVVIEAEDGARGEYVTHWGGTSAAFAQTLMLAPRLIGCNSEAREDIFSDCKRELRAYDRMGYGPLDIALWDLAGKRYGMSVKSMLGGFKDRLPTYASAYVGQEVPGGLHTPEDYADYAQHCKELGFHGFKIHPWPTGNVDREIRNLLGVRARIGDDMKLMIDTSCQLRNWADALRVGRACDEANCFWFEDPYRDTGAAAFSHRKLREFIKTPILLGEYVRGLELKGELLLSDATDLLHLDPEYDMGITGAIKLARFCEILGIDVQYHACGPAHRICNSATRNTHMYEMALIGPDMPNTVPPVYACGYGDQESNLGPDGCVPVPDGPGLGVKYDWDFINANRVSIHVFD